MTFLIKNEDSLDARDTKMPPELVKAMYDLKIQSIIDIGCGSGWLCDYMPPNTKYLGIDQNPTAIINAKKLHPEGRFVNSTIENFFLHGDTNEKFDAAFLKCMFCTVTKETAKFIVALIEKCVTKYILLYDTEKEPMIWARPFATLGYQLKFTHIRESFIVRTGGTTLFLPPNQLQGANIPGNHSRSQVEIWSMV